MTDLADVSTAELLKAAGVGAPVGPDLSHVSTDELARIAGVGGPKGNPGQTGIDRALHGGRDTLDAGAQMLTHSLPNSVVDAVNNATAYVNRQPVIGPVTKALGMVPATAKQIDSDVAARERQYQADRAASGDTGIDWYRMAGNVASTLPVAAMGGAPASMLGAFGRGVASGAATGALTPVTDQSRGFWDQKAEQAGAGAVAGGVLAPIGYGVSRLIQPNVSPEVRQLMDAGVRPTPGQILGGSAQKVEEKLTSVPVVGDMIGNSKRRAIEQFNRASFDKALEPIGEKSTASVGREAVSEAKGAFRAAYDNLLPKLTFKADQEFAQDLGNLAGMASAMPAPQAERFASTINNKLLSRLGPNGTMDGQTLKGVESELARISKGLKGDASFDNREVGDALGEVLASIRSTLERSNPQYADELQKINKGYAMFARVRDAASRVGAEDGVFTPAQLQSAVRAGDKSAGKGAFATGDALMQDLSEAGKKVLGSKYPDSGTAGRQLMAGAGGVLATGSANAVNPIAGAVVAAGLLPYTKTGQELAARLLAGKRWPAVTQPLADAIRAASVPAAISARGLLSP